MMVTTLRTIPGAGVASYTYYSGTPQSFVEQVPFTAAVAVIAESRSPKIRRVKPKDLFANATPWERSSSTTAYGTGTTFERRDSQSYVQKTGPVSHWAGPVLPALDTLLDTADFGLLDLKMRLKIRDEKVDLYSTIAELGQTSDMMFNLFRDLTSAVKRLKSGQTFSTLVRTLKEPRTRTERRIANRWLDYQYGALPTLSDIYGLAEAAVTRANEGIPHYKKARQVEEKQFDVSGGLVTGPVTVKTIHTVKTRFMVRNSSLAKATQLGLTNPVASAYNLLPWSFVVDWAFSVGDFLQGFDALIGVSDLVVQHGIGRDVRLQQKVSGVMSEDPWPIRYESKERARLPVSSDLAYGSPYLHNPFGNTTWKTRLANATALLQQFRR